MNNVVEKCCSRCKQVQPIENFAMKDPKTGRRQGHCRTCQKDISRAHYLRNTETCKARAAARKASIQPGLRAVVAENLKGRSCLKCGATENLTFYARRDTEGACVSAAVHQGMATETVPQAIESSDVLCTSCIHTEQSKALRAWQQERATQSESQPAKPKISHTEYAKRRTRSPQDGRRSKASTPA